MRLKLDENLGRRAWVRLREAGHDVETVMDEALSGQSDRAVIDAAVAARRALVTLDLDFADPVRFPPGETSGLIVLRVHDRPGRQDLDAVIERLVTALGRADATGRLWIVEPTRVRQFEESPGTTGAGDEDRGV